MENGVAREASTSATSNPNAAKAPPASADHDEADPRSKVKQTAVFKEPAGPDELLAGEVVLAQVRSTTKYRLLSERSHGTIGVLFVTNYKLSFIPADRSSYDLSEEENDSAAPVASDSHNIPLTLISRAWTTEETGSKRKRLSNETRMQGVVGSLEIFCKDFFKISFGFKFAKKEDVSLLISSLTVYAFPTSITRVFAFDYAGSLARRKSRVLSGALQNEGTPESSDVSTFRSAEDWQKELDRLNAGDKWRISSANEQFALCESLPAFVVCPVAVRDTDLFSAAVCHKHGRIPTWCWSHWETGVALLRGACRKINEKSSVADGNLRRALDSSSFWSGKVQVINLDKCCPSTRDFQASFDKVQELCTFDAVKDWQTESRWLLNLGNTQWMAGVKACLDAASTAVSLLHERKDSVLIEDSDGGRDLACVVTSLAQIIIDPYYRTVKGLEELIQKEWVVAGHRFMTRCAHLVGNAKKSHLSVATQPGSSFSLPRRPADGKDPETTWYDKGSLSPTDSDDSLGPKQRERTNTSPVKTVQDYDIKKSKSFSAAAGNVDDPGSDLKKHSPVFLLFLDCVHQLATQFPTAFEYTEFFLRHLWTTSYSCLYDTFLFDSESDRRRTLSQLSPITAKNVQMTMTSAWHDVSDAFDKRADTMRNPLYGLVGWKSDFSDNPMHTQPTFLDGNTGLYGKKKKHNVPVNFRISTCLFPNTSQPMLTFWSTCFFQWVSRAHAANGEKLSSMVVLRQVEKEIRWLLSKPGVSESFQIGAKAKAKEQQKQRKETSENDKQLRRSSQRADDVTASTESESSPLCASDVDLTIVAESTPRSRGFTDPSPRRRLKARAASATRVLEKDAQSYSVGNFTDEVMELIKGKGSWDDINPWKKKAPAEAGKASPTRRTSSAETPSQTLYV
ncbi:myotubularin-related protein 10-B-like [Oscarella lobularis]|uniref:myotubularin-related protein 10-B-like n=1 Tax=Oscarella lobularis TaxID=121494 RepID=UPI0033142421